MEKAKAVQKRKAKAAVFPSDAESVELRKAGAVRDGARVVRVGGQRGYFGDFDVSSKQWPQPYRVEIRSLLEPLNTCSCQDHRMNGLGTCKHVERVLQFLEGRSLRGFAAAARRGPDTYEVFFDAHRPVPRLRLLRPALRHAAVDACLDAYFDGEGIATAEPLAVWAALAAALSRLSVAVRRRVRCSVHAEYWLKREQRAADLRLLQQRFDADIAKGKCSDNPVALELYPYQKAGMRHLAFKGRALLADDMGLGKTAQAIAAAELLRQRGQIRRVLVVTPASLKAEWEEQIEKFTGSQAHPVYGLRPARMQAYSQDHAYTLANYEQVRNDVDEINRLLVPDLVILDEAQRIKNWPTRTAKTIKRLESPFAFVLTGTPLENRIEELYSLVEFIDPHVFGSLFRFQREYMMLTDDNTVVPRNLEQLHRVAAQVMLRRRKSDVEDSLPARTDKNYFVTLTAEQRSRYAELEYEVAMLLAILKRRPLTPKERDRLQIKLGCMRMLCDTPYILDEKCRDCPKLEELESILDEIQSEENAKIIIFSEWVRMLDLVKEMLEAKGIEYAEHTGRIPQQKRRVEINRFKQDPDCRIFLSSESGGTGLNLQVARIVINLDLPWNPAKLEQRIARAWRKHQKNSVRVINLVAENTIEHQMLSKLAYKSALADSVLDGSAFTPPSQAGGRSAFADRVSELLGGGEAKRPVAEAAAERSAPPSQRGVLASRHAHQIMGIERQTESGATLIVARPGADLEALRREAGDAEVLTPEIKALLLRLQEKGVLTLASELTTLHAGDDYTPLRPATPRRPALHFDKARRLWDAAQAEVKAAQALGQLGLMAQAAPHVTVALRAGRDALAVLYAVEVDKPLPEIATATHRALWKQSETWLQAEQMNADTMQHALEWVDDIQAELRK